MSKDVHVNSIHIGYILTAYSCANFHKENKGHDNPVPSLHLDHYLVSDFDYNIFTNNRGREDTIKYITKIIS